MRNKHLLPEMLANVICIIAIIALATWGFKAIAHAVDVQLTDLESTVPASTSHETSVTGELF